MGNSEIEKICKQIYKKHSTALDLIFQYRPDIELRISEYVQKIISQTQSISQDRAAKTVINFTTSTIDRFLDKVSEGWTKSKRILLFEFYNYDNRLTMNLIIGPGPHEYRKKILSVCQGLPVVFKLSNKKFGTKWHTVYQKIFLEKKDFEDSSFDEITEKISKRWDEFIMNDLPRINSHFETNWANPQEPNTTIMLYPKPLEKLIWGDIEIFCQQGIPEDTYRDYKEDFPTNLEKTVAAMANALGGIILKRYLLGDGYEKTFYDMHRKSRI